jgi:hypothetical protein
MFAQVGRKTLLVYALAPSLPSIKCRGIFFEQGMAAQAGEHRLFLARELVAVCTHPAAAGGAVRLFSRVANYGFGFAGWAVHLGIIVCPSFCGVEIIPILKKQHTGIKIEEEINPPPLGGIFSLNFFPCVSGVKKIIFSIFFPIFSLPHFPAFFSHSF